MTTPARTPDDTRSVLEARARALARAPERRATTERRELLTFALRGETYGVDAQAVLGLFRLHHLAPLPGASEHTAGLTTWRGALLTVIDLRRLFELPPAGLDDRAWVVALGDARRRCGLLASAGQAVMTVAVDTIRTGADADRHPWLEGVTPEAVLVLSTEKLLALEV